ncbi:MAG: carboxyltransferase domain-containing protein [Bacillota bacterium]
MEGERLFLRRLKIHNHLGIPGGWQIIGQIPLKLYDPESTNLIHLSSVHYLRFVPISKSEYEEIENSIQLGEYKVKCIEK